MTECCCRTCKHWNGNRVSVEDEEGECHRMPPTLEVRRNVDDGDAIYLPYSWFPPTDNWDWCGEWSNHNTTTKKGKAKTA